jgi:hypothetical protein
MQLPDIGTPTVALALMLAPRFFVSPITHETFSKKQSSAALSINQEPSRFT